MFRDMQIAGEVLKHENGYTGGIEFVRGLVHEGRMNYLNAYFASVANGGTVDIAFVCGAAVPRATAAIATGGECKTELYRGATVTGGTVVPIYNADDNLDYSGSASVYHSPSVSAAGSLIAQGYIAGGSGGNAVGNVVQMDSERALRPDTTYLRRIINMSGKSIEICYSVEFYEVA